LQGTTRGGAIKDVSHGMARAIAVAAGNCVDSSKGQRNKIGLADKVGTNYNGGAPFELLAEGDKATFPNDVPLIV